MGSMLHLKSKLFAVCGGKVATELNTKFGGVEEYLVRLGWISLDF
jgi:hypothetical protein